MTSKELDKENREYCEEKGSELGNTFDFDDLLDWIGNDDVISKENDVIRWNWIGGVNWYGETIAAVEAHKDGRFRVEKGDVCSSWFVNLDLYDMLNEVLVCWS